MFQKCLKKNPKKIFKQKLKNLKKIKQNIPENSKKIIKMILRTMTRQL